MKTKIEAAKICQLSGCYMAIANGNYINTKTDSAVSVGWHFIAMTYDGNGLNGMNIYIDGQQAACSPSMKGNYVAMNDTGTDVLLGSFFDGSGIPICQFKDKIDTKK